MGKGTAPPEASSLQAISLLKAAARSHSLPEASSQGEGQFVERVLGLCPGSRGMGISSARPTLRVGDSGPYARFGKILGILQNA